MLTEQSSLTILISTYNLADRVQRCIESLAVLTPSPWLQIIFVDDCSTDGTYEIVNAFAQTRSDVSVLRTEQNSGSPSTPRNLGLYATNTRYVFILDGDDSLVAENVIAAAHEAASNDWEVTRGYLQIKQGRAAVRSTDRLTGPIPQEKELLVARFVEVQSVGCMAVISVDLIKRSGVIFDPAVKMGEDLRFMADLLVEAERVGYFDKPLFQYNKATDGQRSSTTTMRDSELTEFVGSWDYVQQAYRRINVDFLALHGVGTISYGLRQMIWHAGKISEDAFCHLSRFVNANWPVVSTLAFSSRIWELVEAARLNNYQKFSRHLKLRMLIAGHDLKFIRGAEDALSDRYEIEYDEWPSERVHDSAKSRELLEWADFVWVEWMTAASVWYSTNVSPDQRLIIRAHFYEITRDSGFELDLKNVAAIVAIAVHTYEDLVERFAFPRQIVRLIPNFYETQGYSRSSEPGRRFRLALVGSVPSRKGYARALELLEKLVAIDERYTLTVFGKGPDDFGWVGGDPAQRNYYDACDRFIQDRNLKNHVVFGGWVDTKAELANFAFTLSLSDFEGSHVSPGEAFCAGSEGLFLDWRGVEYVYPPDTIFSGVDAMAAHILQADVDSNEWCASSDAVRDFLARNQDTSIFVREVDRLVRSIAP